MLQVVRFVSVNSSGRLHRRTTSDRPTRRERRHGPHPAGSVKRRSTGLDATGTPSPGVTEPESGQHMECGGFRTSIRNRDSNEDFLSGVSFVTPRRLREVHVIKFRKGLNCLPLLTCLVLTFTGLVAPGYCQQSAAVTGDQTSGYRMKVVSRSTEAVDYRHKGSTKVDLTGHQSCLRSARRSQTQAEQARQQAELDKQQATQQAQQAETDKAQMRARMLQQLNQILETTDTARGLIVNMPDVLFDTGKADLQPVARERLAKVAGILIAYPDIRVEIDGYTDSTGSLEFNQQLSQQRADAVRNYLASQGVNSSAIRTQGFGPSQPIASNDTPSGRQQNRRVELVVSGSSIGQATGQTVPDQDTSASPANSGQAGPALPAPPSQTNVPAGQVTIPQR